MERQAFTEALAKTKIPILVLDQKWHRLFALDEREHSSIVLGTVYLPCLPGAEKRQSYGGEVS